MNDYIVHLSLKQHCMATILPLKVYTPGDLPNPGIEPMSLVSPALAVGFFTASATREDRPVTACSFNTISSRPIHALANGKISFSFFFFFFFLRLNNVP